MVKVKKVTKDEFLQIYEEQHINPAYQRLLEFIFVWKDAGGVIGKKVILEQLLHSDSSPIQYLEEAFENYLEILVFKSDEKQDFIVSDDFSVMQYHPKGDKNNGTDARMYV